MCWWIADVTPVEEPTPGPNGAAPVGNPARPTRVGLGPRGHQDASSQPGSASRSRPDSPRKRSVVAPSNNDWTFVPDQAFVQSTPQPGDKTASTPPAPSPPRRRSALAPRVGVVVIVGALITGGLALTHVGPFHSSPRVPSSSASIPNSPADVRGTWDALTAFNRSLYWQTLHITTESLGSGAFSGTVTSPVGIEALKGSVSGAAMSFTIRLGHDTDSGTGTVSVSKGRLRIDGVFSNLSG